MTYYVEDTAIDLMVNVAGGPGFFVFVEGTFWPRGQADARRGDSPLCSAHVRSDGGETPDDDRRSNHWLDRDAPVGGVNLTPNMLLRRDNVHIDDILSLVYASARRRYGTASRHRSRSAPSTVLSIDPRMLGRTLNETVLAGWEECPREMATIAVFGSVVTVTHFTSMALFLYARIWWRDVLVHAALGLGVMMILYVLNPRPSHSWLALLVALPMVVAAVRTWFEVYEWLFTGFRAEWSRSVCLEDVAVDIVADTAGAVVFGVVGPPWNRIRHWRDLSRL